jgi:hypothetical protein
LLPAASLPVLTTPHLSEGLEAEDALISWQANAVGKL